MTALERIAELQPREIDADYFEFDIATDNAGIAVRQYLKALTD